MKRPVAVDLFAGCGGMSLGLEAAGFDVAVSVEYDAVHSVVHHFNFPYGTTMCRDVSTVSGSEILQALSKNGYSIDVDLVAGGPPCQGFSQMGKRQLDDPRNSLVFEYVRIISEIRPKYFVFENVPGIASGAHRKFLDELIEEFEGLGYKIEKPVQILDASLFGAPQKRKRLIIMGSRGDVEMAYYPKPKYIEDMKGTSDLINDAEGSLNTVGDAISNIASVDVFTHEDYGIPPEMISYSGYSANFALKSTGLFRLCHVRTGIDKIWGHLGSVHTQISMDRFAETVPGEIEPKSRFLRLKKDGLCNTLRAGTNSDKGAFTAPRPIHFSLSRCISIREAARLHTYPDWFQFHRTIWHGFREIGNSVIPMLAKELGNSIIAALNIDVNELEIKSLVAIDDKLLRLTMSKASAYWGVNDDLIAKRKRLI
ncbi:DNA-cytosine methyltransferase family protein [Rhodoferax antarcticus ANT.BR]|uniref:Cytosine-specific methyltransferase n=2 Tax=Rhodoferax antarcticus TaxID=81479 RepID=A0A1Q8YG44_9BURK|nr:DNA (cytosine-5-)-methyltransferase [Rhodoferax antarcticus]OLP06965.1 DNA-cytosine methyltransferase family protein [Rhodoferax antarcticus ANT.BR]